MSLASWRGVAVPHVVLAEEITPHISGVGRATFEARIGDIGTNLLALPDGSPLINPT